MLYAAQPPRTYTAPTLFSFHTANAFEEGGQLHVDLSVYNGPDIVNDLNLDRLLQFPGRDISRCVRTPPTPCECPWPWLASRCG